MSLSRPMSTWHMIGWERNLKDLKSVQLYGDKYFVLNKKLALDRCPHRGASLSQGKVVDKSVRCPYHSRYFSSETQPEMFGGVIQDNALWYGGEDISEIPRIEEFDDDSYRSLYMTRRLKGVNAMAFLEGTLDVEHVGAVHAIKINDILAPASFINEDKQKNTISYDAPKFSLKIENQFWLPFSNCLKFYLYDKRKDRTYEPFILFFGITPHSDNDITLHIRSMRKKIQRDLDVLLDPLFIAASDIPVKEDYEVVKHVDMKSMAFDQLSAEDDFIKLYRAKMLKRCPDILDYMVT